MTFPGLLNLCPPKIPPGNPLRGVGQFILGENESQINAHMRAKFGRGPTVVSKKWGVQSVAKQ